MKEVSLLYNGDGNFFILASNHMEQRIEKLKEEIMYKLITAHDGGLYFAIDYINLNVHDFMDFPRQWRRVGNETDIEIGCR